jgi:parallel beta-helix repeat protein
MSKRIFSLTITSILLLVLVSFAPSIRFIPNQEILGNCEAGNYAAYIPVPFHWQETDYYCGPAALEMIFDYYGEDIPQTEIADVARTESPVTFTDELRRAAHFSNLSTSQGNELPYNFTGYSDRKIGYAAFERGGLTIDDLKALIDDGKPIITLMWMIEAGDYGHFRVVIGYNETHIITHDPWFGANMTYVYSAFLDLWQYSGNWGLVACPWLVELQMPSTIDKGENFEAIVNATYPCPIQFDPYQYSASFCNATIDLPEGLELAAGETARHSLGDVVAGSSANTSWSICASKSGSYSVTVTVAGAVHGSVGWHRRYPAYNYEDAIGGCSTGLLSTRQVHNLDTGLNYTTIQEAINDPATLDGHTVFVEKGTYYEHVTVNKTLSLIGEDRNNTIIDGNRTGNVVSVERSNVTITEFTIRNGSIGIRLDYPDIGESHNITLRHNIIRDIVDGGRGILIFSSVGNTITENAILNCWMGIQLGFSTSNIISQNVISDNKEEGIDSGLIIVGPFSPLNTATDTSNKIFENQLSNNGCGINITNRADELVLHNNFVNNTVQAYVLQQYEIKTVDFWDNGFEGNYWSDHNRTDADQDGIVDTQYEIDASNIDHYPLMGMFSSFNTPAGFNVNVISNSTIEDFEYSESNNTIKMRVSNTTERQTQGFCRICIPHSLMNETYNVTIDGANPTCWNYTVYDNGTHRWIYFSYQHSTHEVIIVPEFHSFIILPLLTAMTSLAIIVHKRRKQG